MQKAEENKIISSVSHNEEVVVDEQRLEKFFSLLFEIDKRKNPHLYKKGN